MSLCKLTSLRQFEHWRSKAPLFALGYPDSLFEFSFTGILIKGLLVEDGLWKEIKLRPSVSSLVAGLPSHKFSRAVWRMWHRSPSSMGICASRGLTVASGISTGVSSTRPSSVTSIILICLLSSIEDCCSGESRMHCTTAFISPFSSF